MVTLPSSKTFGPGSIIVVSKLFFIFQTRISFSSFSFSKDEDAGKVLILCSTPKGGPLKANEWVNSCSAVIGGKGGGKDVQAQASGKETAKVNEAIELAKQFAATKL